MERSIQTADQAPATARARWMAGRWRTLLFAAALALGIAGRLSYSWGAPLWFDETFSGAIASQGNVAGLLRWCLSEVTGPAYYMPLWLWAQLFGDGDTALRLPSLLCSIAAPLLIWRNGSDDRDLRLFWSVLVLLWLPASVVAFEARPYPQLFLLCTAQAIAFVRLADRPGRGRLFAWSGLTALAILSNYNALAIGGVQGVLYLARHRKAALATWPGLLPFLPMAGWMALHLAFLLRIASAHAAAYRPLPLAQLTSLPAVLFGLPLHGTIILGTILVALAIRQRRGAAWRQPSAEQLLALSGMIAVAVVFALAFVRPGFAPRYLTPAMPALLFGIALWARWQCRHDAKPVAIVLAMLVLMNVGVIRSTLSEPDSDARHLFNLEQPSAWLAERHPARLAFLWDGPIGNASKGANLAEVAGYFFKRAGTPVAVRLVDAGRDPNAAVLAAASAPGTAILWMSNDRLGGAHVPRIAALDPRWDCRDFGGGQVVVTACRRQAS